MGDTNVSNLKQNHIVAGSLLTMLLLSLNSYAGVSEIKNSGKAKPYAKTESLGATKSKPGFITDSLGSSNWKPRLDLSNGIGSPSINLANSSGSNSSIGSQISNSKPKTGWWHKKSYKPNGVTLYSISSVGSCQTKGLWARLETPHTTRSCRKGGRGESNECSYSTTYTYTYYKCQ